MWTNQSKSSLSTKTTKSLFSESDCLLVLGEGNFSFTKHLSQFFKCKIIATELTTHSKDPSVEENCQHLLKSGHSVYFGIDATKLEDYPELRSRRDITHIIFNFPHILSKKMKIGLNRELLKQFFESTEKFIRLTNNVKVMVSLCSGQSGINSIEEPDKQRLWSDSWQLPEMATNGNFVITSVNDFCFDYQLFGYRLKNISFDKNNAKTFVFQKRDNIEMNCNHLSQTLLNYNKNLFSNHLVIELITNFKEIFKESLEFETGIDLNTNIYPFVKHWIILKSDNPTLSKLDQMFGNSLIVCNEDIILENIKIGQIFEKCIKLSIEQLARLKWNITDSRILWSKYLHFDEIDQKFKTGSLFHCQHIHDISFWINSDSYYSQLLHTILDTFSTLLKSIKLIDCFVLNNKTSKCYRIVYESVDCALSQQKCNQMQNIVRNRLKENHNFDLR